MDNIENFKQLLTKTGELLESNGLHDAKVVTEQSDVWISERKVSGDSSAVIALDVCFSMPPHAFLLFLAHGVRTTSGVSRSTYRPSSSALTRNRSTPKRSSISSRSPSVA